MFRKVILKPFLFGIEPGAKLKGGMGSDSHPPPNPDFAEHRGSLQGKNVEFDMRK